MSTGAKKVKGKQIRGWHLNRRSGMDLSGLAREINPQVRGWINYYGGLLPLRAVLPRIAHQWASSPMGHAEVQTPAKQAGQGLGLARCCETAPALALCPLAHASIHLQATRGGRMRRESHVRFCESGRGRFPPATHQNPPATRQVIRGARCCRARGEARGGQPGGRLCDRAGLGRLSRRRFPVAPSGHRAVGRSCC
ncbi:MAG: group II intron maturase-specific domain-containing protein [Acidimicrobiales bacterium]